jgi:hypothetical protein
MAKTTKNAGVYKFMAHAASLEIAGSRASILVPSLGTFECHALHAISDGQSIQHLSVSLPMLSRI